MQRRTEMNFVMQMCSSVDIRSLIDFYFGENILIPYAFCTCCKTNMRLEAHNSALDKYSWRCINVECKKFRTTSSLRKGSFLQNFRITLQDSLRLMFSWADGTTIVKASEHTGLHKETVGKFYDSLRSVCRTYFQFNPVSLGGEKKIVQIDESCFSGKPKYNRGRRGNQCWVFGLLEIGTLPYRSFLCVVPDRSSATLFPIINKVVIRGTTIHSDEWRAYCGLDSLLYPHYTVNHSLEYVNKDTGAHTQNIESFWAKAKYRVKLLKGIRKNKLQDYLYEFMWKDLFVLSPFKAILRQTDMYLNRSGLL
jgi:transposase-like protein